MKLHEYQAKDVIEKYGVAVQPGWVARTVDEAVAAAKKLAEAGNDKFVVKAQIHAGGRGKGGGVKLATSIEDVREKAEAILGMNLVTHQTGPEGQLVRAVLVTGAVDIAKEYYVGVTLDRTTNQDVIMVSTEGGVEIETVAEETPHLIHKAWIEPGIGLQAYQARELAFALGFEGETFKQATRFITALYRAYQETDASLAEINPLVLTEQGDVVAIDAKFSLDSNALFRHKDLLELRDIHEEAPLEVEASEHGLQAYQARELAFALGFEGETFKQATRFITALYRAYQETDASLAEINPLVLTEQGDVVAIDAKFSLDSNALFRHKDLLELRDIHEEAPLEVEASEHGLNYIKLDGNVGCMVNGAGLAMATMDIIKIAGGEPANFLDVGGGASAETVEAGFRIILKDPNVKAILVNIFGGIVRCDRVANGVVEAAKNVDIDVPLIVRLQGTNAEEGQAILEQSGLKIETAILLKEAAEKVTSALGTGAAA